VGKPTSGVRKEKGVGATPVFICLDVSRSACFEGRGKRWEGDDISKTRGGKAEEGEGKEGWSAFAYYFFYP